MLNYYYFFLNVKILKFFKYSFLLLNLMKALKLIPGLCVNYQSQVRVA